MVIRPASMHAMQSKTRLSHAAASILTVISTAGLLLIILSGCSTTGRLYTNIIEPYTEDYNNTPVGLKKCIIKNHRFREPISRLNISAEWSVSDIIEQAHTAGIQKIYYMDVRTLSILSEIYRRKDIIIYGD